MYIYLASLALPWSARMYVRACVRACVRARVCVCVCVLYTLSKNKILKCIIRLRPKVFILEQ